MITDFLQSIGLNEKEIRLYLLLFRYGTQPTSSLAKHAGISRSTAYSSLHRLLQRGLISETKSHGVQYFSGLQPSQLVQYIEQDIQNLMGRKEKAKEAAAALQKLRSPLVKDPMVEVFTGTQGAQLALLQTLEGDHRTIYAFTSLADLSKRIGEDFLATYTQNRVKAKKHIALIRTEQKYKQALAQQQKKQSYETSAKELREVRYVSNAVKLSLGLYIAGSRIVVISSKEENYALVIQSKDLSHLLSGMFKTLWGLLPSA
jgi:sugar-specific transcriptional regulator TrmB